MGQLLSGHPERCATAELGPYVAGKAMCLHALGKTQEATVIVDSLRRMFNTSLGWDSTFSRVLAARGLAAYFAWIGDSKESLAWLERAYSISPNGEMFQVLVSGVYQKVRNDPTFEAGLTRLQREVYDRVDRARREAALR